MAELRDGEQVQVQGVTNRYTLSRNGDVYACSCPAWRNMGVRIALRRCKHLRAYLGDTVLPGAAPMAPVPVTTPRAAFYDASEALPTDEYVATPELHAARERALTNAVDHFVVLFDKMEEVYGLRLPEHLAHAAGFFMGLTRDERAELAFYAGTGLIGVGAWFGEDALSQASQDERLRDRHRDDPPEFVSVFAGTEPGERWGLWYDDPSELPVAIAFRRAVPSAETTLGRSTLLATLRDRMTRAPADAAYPHHAAILGWLAEVARRYPASFHAPAGSIPSARTGTLLGGPVPFIPGWTIPADLMGPRDFRLQSYRRDATSADELIAKAFEELRVGEPGRALFVGRELHWLDQPERRRTCSELLIRAYAALGRRALAEVVRAHYLERDPDADVYELPPPHPLIMAASLGDVGELTACLNDVGEDEIVDAVAASGSAEALDMLLARAEQLDAPVEESQLAAILWRRLSATAPPDADMRERHRKLILRLLELAPVSPRVFQRVVAIADTEHLRTAAARVDVTARGAYGYTALHFATCAALPDAVRTLLDRGADARAKDADGKTPFDAGLLVWHAKPREEAQVNAMLEAAGGAPWRAASASAAVDPAWQIGVKVSHVKFGEGVIEAVVSGEETKLKVRFGKKDQKVLLAKFLTRT